MCRPIEDGGRLRSDERFLRTAVYSYLLGAGMDRFFSARNIDRYRKLASKETTEIERKKIWEVLTEEEDKFKLELRTFESSDQS